MKRARQLLVPFLSWALAVSLIKQNFSLFFNIIKQPDNGLWFLWALFFIYIAFLATMFLNRFCKNSLICSLLILCGLYCCSFIMNGILGSNLIAKYYLYYMVGYFIAKKDIIDSVPNKKKNVIMLLCLLSFILLGYFWKRTEYVFIPFEQFIYNKFINKLFNILTALLGIISIILIFKTIKRTHYIVSYIGQRTLAIYAIHFFVLDFFILPNNNIFFLIVILPIVIVVSLLFEYLLSLNKYTSLFFLGKTS